MKDDGPAAVHPMNIGIYGATFAGKTRFLYELLNEWHQDHRLLSCSENCHAFLATVAVELSQFGRSMPTTSTTEGITVRVRREKGEPAWELTVRDLRGEFLTGELDNLVSVARNGIIPAQVQQCDAFLYFFDPTSAEHKDRIDKHHEKELKRAELFIDYLLSNRQNAYLPIVFVMTRLDEWENDPDMRRRAEKWTTDVNLCLQKHYRAHLGKHYPPICVDAKHTSFAISNIRGKGLEQVVQRAYTLTEECKQFSATTRRSAFRLAVVAVLFTVLCCALLGGTWWFTQGGGNSNDGKETGEGTETTTQRIERLTRLVASHPTGRQLLSPDKAKDVNRLLRRLIAEYATLAGGQSRDTKSQALCDQLTHALEATGKLLCSKNEMVDTVISPEYIATLTIYLQDLPIGESKPRDLITAEGNYWKLRRRASIDAFASVLRRREAVASSPTDSLSEIITESQLLRQNLQQCLVAPAESRQLIVEEVKCVETFCEDRKKERGYPVKFRLVSARLIGDVKDRNWRAITLRSPGPNFEDIGLRWDDSSIGFATEQPTYELKLGLGRPVTCSVSVYDSVQWKKVEEFDVSQPTDVPSLGALGMAFIRPDQITIPQELTGTGHRLSIEISTVLKSPSLLSAAAKACCGGKSNDR